MTPKKTSETEVKLSNGYLPSKYRLMTPIATKTQRISRMWKVFSLIMYAKMWKNWSDLK